MKGRTKFREWLNKVVALSKKYAWRALLVVALVLGGFLIGRPISSIIKSNRDISNLQQEKAGYQERMSQDSLFIENLNNNDEFLEQYAREKYFMQGKNEHIYIID